MKHSVFLCFYVSSVSFLVKFGLKPVFHFLTLCDAYVCILLRNALLCRGGLCWRSVFLRVCLLVWFVLLFLLGLIGWIIGWGCRPVCLFERLFQLFERVSCRPPESLCVASRVDACRPCRAVFFLCLRSFAIVFACFVVYGVLRTAVTSACQSGGFLFDFELPIRQVERWTAYYRLLFLSASRAVAPRFLLFS